jgi:hypothetical protein
LFGESVVASHGLVAANLLDEKTVHGNSKGGAIDTRRCSERSGEKMVETKPIRAIVALGLPCATKVVGVKGGQIQLETTPFNEVLLSADRFLDHLAAQGFVIVPKEPTESMLTAVQDWSYKKYGKPIGNDGAVGCWGAMIGAATTPEADNAEGIDDDRAAIERG